MHMHGSVRAIKSNSLTRSRGKGDETVKRLPTLLSTCKDCYRHVHVLQIKHEGYFELFLCFGMCSTLVRTSQDCYGRVYVLQIKHECSFELLLFGKVFYAIVHM